MKGELIFCFESHYPQTSGTNNTMSWTQRSQVANCIWEWAVMARVERNFCPSQRQSEVLRSRVMGIFLFGFWDTGSAVTSPALNNCVAESVLKILILCLAWWSMPYSSSWKRQVDLCEFRTAWALSCDPGQPDLCSEILSWKIKKK